MPITDVDTVISLATSKATGSSLSGDSVLSFLNACLFTLASKVSIKELETTGEVDTDSTNSVALPTDYHKKLTKCYNTTSKRWVTVYHTRRKLDDHFASRDAEGDVTAIAVHKGSLYYQKIPSTAQTLKLYYYEKPEVLVDGGDFPDYIPEDLVFDLFYQYLLYRIYETVEDGIDGEKPNTIYHENKYKTALVMAETYFFGYDPGDPESLEESDGFNFSSLQ